VSNLRNQLAAKVWWETRIRVILLTGWLAAFIGVLIGTLRSDRCRFVLLCFGRHEVLFWAKLRYKPRTYSSNIVLRTTIENTILFISWQATP
jgi:hypothetical protein